MDLFFTAKYFLLVLCCFYTCRKLLHLRATTRQRLLSCCFCACIVAGLFWLNTHGPVFFVLFWIATVSAGLSGLHKISWKLSLLTGALSVCFSYVGFLFSTMFFGAFLFLLAEPYVYEPPVLLLSYVCVGLLDLFSSLCCFGSSA